MKVVSEQQLSKAVGAAISKVRVQCGLTQDYYFSVADFRSEHWINFSVNLYYLSVADLTAE